MSTPKNYRIQEVHTNEDGVRDATLHIDQDGLTFEAKIQEPMLKRIEQEECTCRIIVSEVSQMLMLGGSDDCPVHGFGG